MKKQLLAGALLLATVYACNDNSGKTASTTAPDASAETKPAADDYSKNPDYQKGLDIIGKSDCLTCHKIEETSTGPAYRDIANKYTNDEKTITMLSEKIIKGGSGVWGQVPMAPHPTLTPDEAKQLAKYVMIFKNN